MHVILQAHRASDSLLDVVLGNMNYSAPLKEELEQSLAGAINLVFFDRGFSPLPCQAGAATAVKMLNARRRKHLGPGIRDGTHAHVAHAIKGVNTNTFAAVLGHPPLHPQGGGEKYAVRSLAGMAAAAAASESVSCAAPEEREADVT